MNPAFQDFLQAIPAGAKLRLAPTPSGYLHAGNALNFLLNHRAAREKPRGKILLRIDDLDAERKRPEFVHDIFETLDWLGLDWDEGPRSAADFEENWSQRHRLPLYENLLQQLKNQGFVFACRKSRRDLAPFGGGYPPEFRDQKIGLDEPDAAWRVRTPEGFPMSDFVVRRRDGVPAYQIASLADDLHFGVTHVVRGADLAASTRAQIFLAEQLGLYDFLKTQFFHHPLLTDARGEKLSKSAGSDALRALRERGETAAALRKMAADF